MPDSRVLRLALGPAIAQSADYFDLCRRKRNAVDYDLANVVTETEIGELFEKAASFRDLVEQWISQHHPNLAR